MQNEFVVDQGTNGLGQSIKLAQIDDDEIAAVRQYRVYVDDAIERYTESAHRARVAFVAALALEAE